MRILFGSVWKFTIALCEAGSAKIGGKTGALSNVRENEWVYCVINILEIEPVFEKGLRVNNFVY
jgi:hypothetical protein